MRHQAEYAVMLYHSYYLRSAINIAHDRHQRLEQTRQNLGLSNKPMDSENIRSLQLQTAKEIGGVNTRMLLDAPEEIGKYHFGPLQIALCLLYAIIEKYRKLVKIYPAFQDNAIDKYCHENEQFVWLLKDVRDSILHQRHDNIEKQQKFVQEHSGDSSKHCLDLLLEGEEIYRDYLRRLWHQLGGGKQNEK